MAHKKGFGSSRNTLFALCDGTLEFTRGVKRRVHVRPDAEAQE